jgi:hypothetical protein
MPKGERTVVTEEHLAACPEGARILPLTQSWICWVDEEDYEPLVARGVWCAAICKFKYDARAYAHRNEGRKTVVMARLIMNAQAGMDVDHKVHLPSAAKVIDNRKGNLRVCDRSQNVQNRAYWASSSGPRGVQYLPRLGKWQARICLRGRRIQIGCFATELEAALAYDEASLRLHGEFGRRNLPDYGSHLSLETLIANGKAREAAQLWDG